MIQTFGTLPDGEIVQRISLMNGRMRANILTYGATLQSLHLAPHNFSLVLGYPELPGYLENPYFGAMVGRVANRLAHGKIALDGKTFLLDRNEHGRQTLHGGQRGIAFRNWRITDYSGDHVTLMIEDTPNHGGFPANCQIAITYCLARDSLVIEAIATCNEITVCNIAHHSYFNLDGGSDILGHELCISADSFLPTDSTQIPTGEIAPVAHTHFDFRKSEAITQSAAGVIDHNYCLNREASPACQLSSSGSGITMAIDTDQPGLQVFMANGIRSSRPGHHGVRYGDFCGIALEPQHWPDGPNHSNFPDITLLPGDTYRQKSIFRFTD